MPDTATTPLASYLALPRETLLTRYAAWPDHVPTRLLELDDEQLDTAFVETSGLGRWPTRVLMGHLADCEIMYTFRMRKAVAEENPLLINIDPDAWVDSGMYGNENGGADKPVAGFVAVIHTMRTWTAEWLNTLKPDQWNRMALHPNDGPVSVENILAKAVWHIEHHSVYLQRKLDRLLGPENH